MDATALARLAARQQGLFTRAQARACGYSAYQVRRRLGTGEWVRVLGWVLAVAGIRVSVGLRDRAAGLAVPGSVLAGPSAARLHGMPVPATIPCLAVGRGGKPYRMRLSLLRDPVNEGDLQLLGGVLVTGPARTVFDCARLLPDAAALDLLDRALQQRWTTLEDFSSRVRGFVGRHGARRMAALAGAAGSGAHSGAERLAHDLLRRARITGWRANVPLHDRDEELIGVGDIVFDRERLVVEIDGRAHHVSPDRFERDRERQNRLVAEGWTVLRFTWRDLTTRPDQVRGQVRRMLRRVPLGHG
jgi:very-short-patch-repair endonuclease